MVKQRKPKSNFGWGSRSKGEYKRLYFKKKEAHLVMNNFPPPLKVEQ